MGTRGIFGVRINGQDKITYNHFDSYPEGLGFAVLKDIKAILKKKNGEKWFKEYASALKLIETGINSKPTAEDIKNLRPYTDLGVSEQSTADWYCLTRKLQGHLKLTLESGYMIDSHDFIKDSLFCEWGYIVNLDEGTLEVYKGFQSKAHNLGRYATSEKPINGYYPCALVSQFNLSNLPAPKKFVASIPIPIDE